MKALSIGLTGLRRMFRDRANYFFVFILPLGIIVIVGSLFGSGFRPSLGIVAPEAGPGAVLAERFDGLTDVDLERFKDVDDLLRSVERSNVQAGVVIPDLDVVEGATAEVGFVARPDSAGPQLQSLAAALVTEFSYEVAAARLGDDELVDGIRTAHTDSAALAPITVDTAIMGESMFGGTLGQFDLGASSQLILFMFLTGLTGSAALIQSRQLGVSRRMLSTPTSARTIIIGEALGRFGVVLVQGLYIVFVTLIVFGVNWGDPLGAAAILALFGLTAAGAAMLMGSLFRNDEQAGGIGVMLGLGLGALGGGMVPVEIMPATMQQVAKATPHRWALDAFAVLVRQDGTIADITGQLAVLAAFAAGFLILAGWRFRAVLTRGD